jgi:S1-C subfamily serine protease
MKKLLVMCLLFLTACISVPNYVTYDNAYDFNNIMVRDHSIARMAASVVQFETITHFKHMEGGDFDHKMIGSGVVLDGKYILTVEHVVGVHKYTIQSPFGSIEMPGWTVEKRETTLVLGEKRLPMRVLYRNQKQDVALLELPDGVDIPSFPYKIGSSADLRVGNFVYILGYPGNSGLNIRQGIVSALSAPKQIEQINAIGKNAFMLSNGVMPGDSGTPVVAIRDGRYEIVGVVQGVFKGSIKLGWAIKIDVIKDLLKEVW